MQTFTFNLDTKPLTIAQFLKKASFSLTARRKIKRQASLYIDGKQVSFKDIIGPEQKLDIIFPVISNVIPQQGALKILFEDEYVLAIDKPASMLVHPVGKEITETLANYLYGYMQKKADFDGLHFISRLDRDTSGLILVAKTAYVKHLFSKCNIKKYYLACLCSIPPAQRGIICLPIQRKTDSIIEREIGIYGKTSLTAYKLITKYQDGSCLVQFEAITGRTHQLRVHAAALNCPIVGDSLYGEKGVKTRHLLHACELSFLHPLTHKKITIKSGLPEDMVKII